MAVGLEARVGVSDVEKSLKLYRDVLGYDHVVMDETAVHPAFAPLPSGGQTYRRVVLKRSQLTEGAFSELLGGEKLNSFKPWTASLATCSRVAFGATWASFTLLGHPGHESPGQELEAAGFPFTVDSSSSFDMGEASGQFTYVEDPDGTWIEFVETHKIPIVKKLGWYLDTRTRPQGKPLPKWMLKMLRFSRVKD